MPSIVELLVKEFDTEMAGTRKALEQMPEGQNKFRPHKKSMELGILASLVATMPSWIVSVVQQEKLDLAAGTAPRAFDSSKDLVAAFEKARDAGRKALAATTDDTC